MQEQIISETDYYKITHNQTHNFICFQRIGYNRIEQIKEASQKFLETIKQTQVKKYIIDDSETKVTPQEAQNWLTQEFMQQFPDFIEKMALVQSKDIFQQAVLQKHSFRIEGLAKEKKIEVNFFENVESAKNWLI